MALRAGVIGLGAIGTPMARRVLRGGLPLAVRDLRAEAMAALASEGAHACESAAEVARRADVICVVVLDDAQVEDVIAGRDGILDGAAPGCVICVSSTVEESTIHRVAETAAARDVRVLDAGVAGGYSSAETGTLVATVGGDRASFEIAEPLLATFSKEVLHAGPLGAGMRLKLVKNVISYLALAAGHEGALLAEEAGIDAAVLRRVVDQTNLVEQFFHLGLGRKTGRRLASDAKPELIQHAVAYTAIARKDLAAAEVFAAEFGLDLPFARAAGENAGRLFLLPEALEPSTAGD